MYFDNNPYAVINISYKALFKIFIQMHKDVCIPIGCVDPTYYPDLGLQKDIVYQ
jgi:hypothetical protein